MSTADRLPLDYAGPAYGPATSFRLRMSRGTCAANLFFAAVMAVARSIHNEVSFGFYMIALLLVLLSALLMAVPFLFGVVIPFASPESVPEDFGLPRRQWVEVLIESAVLIIVTCGCLAMADRDIPIC